MAKPRTALQLVERLDNEISWRRTEFSYMKTLVSRARGLDEATSIRAALPLLYAHWEGFVKQAACHYMDFLSTQRLTFDKAKLSFSGLRAHSYVLNMADIRKRIFTPTVLLQQIESIGSERIDVNLRNYVEHLGNLNFDIFEQIINYLSIDPAPYGTIQNLIDSSLLYHRNKIAHGERLEISAARYIELHDQVVAVLEIVKSDIESAAINKSYKR